MDAVLEAQRLRVEQTLLPDGIFGKRDRQLKTVGTGKTLVIESLRVPILSSVINSGSNKNKYSAIEGIENQTRWPGGYRYFVCVVRAAATAHRPPLTVATRPADALEEAVRRFSIDAHCSDKEINYGYVEFITKKYMKSTGTKKCTLPSASEGAPIMITGLNEDGWKVTIELYGLSPTATGELENQSTSSSKDHHDSHENKSVLVSFQYLYFSKSNQLYFKFKLILHAKFNFFFSVSTLGNFSILSALNNFLKNKINTNFAFFLINKLSLNLYCKYSTK